MKTLGYAIFAVHLLCPLLLPSPGYPKDAIKEEIIVLKAGDKHYNARHRTNCVEYARWLTDGKLPIGLYTLRDKKKIITSRSPKKGGVAVMDASRGAGHVAYVSEARISGGQVTLTLLEANNPRGVIRKRTITANRANLSEVHRFAGILGYWDP